MAYAAERIGLPSLNEKQKQAVRAFLGGKDVLSAYLQDLGSQFASRVYRSCLTTSKAASQATWRIGTLH